MKFFVISDNNDTYIGMRLAGMEGVVVHEYDETVAALQKAVGDPNIGVVLMTQQLVSLCEEVVQDYKLRARGTLIAEIPDRHGSSHLEDALSQYIKDAIGVKI